MSQSRCPYCGCAMTTSGGDHRDGCPLKKPAIQVAEAAVVTMQGWICPKCGAVYSPFIYECWRCNVKTITSTGVPK